MSEDNLVFSENSLRQLILPTCLWSIGGYKDSQCCLESSGLWEEIWNLSNGRFLNWTSLVAQRVKHLPTMQETQVRSLGREDLLEKEMATHSSTLAWKIPWMEDPVGLQSMGLQRVGHEWVTSLLLQRIFPTQGSNLHLLCEVMKVAQLCPTLRRPWNSPGQNTGVGSLSLLQGIFPTQGSNPGLPHCRQILYQLSY